MRRAPLAVALLLAAVSFAQNLPSNAGYNNIAPTIPVIISKGSAVSTGSVASVAVTLSATRPGNTIIVVSAAGNGSDMTISDSHSATYTEAVFQANGSAFGVGIYYSNNTTGGSLVVTANNGGANASMAMEVYEFYGLLHPIEPDLQFVVDLTGSSTGTGTVLTAAGGGLDTNYPNEYQISGFAVGTAAQTITPAVSGGTNDSGQLNPVTPAGLFSFIAASRFITLLGGIGGQQNLTHFASAASIGSSEPWSAAAALFVPSAVHVQISNIVSVTGTGSFNTDPAVPVGGGARQPLQVEGTSGNLEVQIMNAGSNARGAAVDASNNLQVVLNAETSKVIGTVNQGTSPWASNVSQINGVTPLMGNGTTGTGSQRVTIASDNTAFAVNATASQSTAASLKGQMQILDTAGTNLATVKASSTPPVITDTALVVSQRPFPNPICTSLVGINQTSGATVISGVASKRVYICSIILVSATAQNIGVIEGTGTVCATSPGAIVGSATTTPSIAVAANGGFAATAFQPWIKTQVDADNVCVTQSGSGNVSGVISYVVQ